MTGKDLIIYILQNNLEDEPIVKDGKFIGLLTDVEFATRLNVGVATVHTMIKLGTIDSVQIGGSIYIFDKFHELRGDHEQIN